MQTKKTIHVNTVGGYWYIRQMSIMIIKMPQGATGQNVIIRKHGNIGNPLISNTYWYWHIGYYQHVVLLWERSYGTKCWYINAKSWNGLSIQVNNDQTYTIRNQLLVSLLLSHVIVMKIEYDFMWKLCICIIFNWNSYLLKAVTAFFYIFFK